MMQRLIEIGRREPVILLALLTTGLALAASFGLDLSADQTKGIMGFAVALGAVLSRMLVTPNVSVAAKANPPEQTVAGPAADVFEGTPVDVVPTQQEELPFNVTERGYLPHRDELDGSAGAERGDASLGYLATVVLVAVLVIVVINFLL